MDPPNLQAAIDLAVGAGVDRRHVEVIDDGWDCLVVTDRRLTVRIPRIPSRMEYLTIEAAFLEDFAPVSPIAVPQLQLGGGHTLHPWLEGDSLEPSIIARWPPSDRSAAGELLGTFLKTLHGFPVQRARELRVPEPDLQLTWMLKLHELRDIVFPVLGPAERSWTEGLYARFLAEIEARPPPTAVIHSDLGVDHLLWDAESRQLIGVIDFGDVEIGDPAFDFAALGWLGLLGGAYQTYGARDPGWDTRLRFYTSGWAVRALRNRIRRQQTRVVESLLEVVRRQAAGDPAALGGWTSLPTTAADPA